MDGEPEHASCGITADCLELVNYPSFYFICEFVKVDIYSVEVFFDKLQKKEWLRVFYIDLNYWLPINF